MSQVATGGAWQSKVSFQLFVNVQQTGRHPHPVLHRKAEAMGLSCTVIGILSEDDDLDCIERGQRQRSKPGAARRVDLLARALFGLKEGAQRAGFRRRQGWFEHGEPAWRNGIRIGHLAALSVWHESKKEEGGFTQRPQSKKGRRRWVAPAAQPLSNCSPNTKRGVARLQKACGAQYRSAPPLSALRPLREPLRSSCHRTNQNPALPQSCQSA